MGSRGTVAPTIRVDIYGGADPRGVPAYTYAEVARYLSLPATTVRTWVRGQHYKVGKERRFFEPLIRLPESDSRQMSFTNVIEVHVLSAIRRSHRISMGKVRTALDYIEKRYEAAHPLARVDFQTDGVDLFVEKYGQLIAVSQQGQMTMRDVLRAHLERIERDEDGLAARLFPYTRTEAIEQPRWVVIDPRIAFGRPALAGTGIPTSVLAERYKAGDSIKHLAEDYDCEDDKIEEAIRCELLVAA